MAILGLVLLAAAFFAGWLPVRGDLVEARSAARACDEERRTARLAERIGQVYLETTEKNYGIAGQASTQFFNEVRQAAEATIDPARKARLQEIAASRDAVTSALAQGDPAALVPLREAFRKTLALGQSR